MAGDQMNTLRSKQVRQTLDRLHDAARADRRKIRRLMPKLVLARLRGKKFEEVMTPATARDIYLPILELLSPRIRTGGVVLADNIFTFKKALAPYVNYVQSGENGFESVTVPIGEGLEYSIRIG